MTMETNNQYLMRLSNNFLALSLLVYIVIVLTLVQNSYWLVCVKSLTFKTFDCRFPQKQPT